jgi:hypothetical protein
MPLDPTISWPVELGCPVRQGYSGTRGQKAIRMDVAEGPARFRLYTDDTPFQFRFSFSWTAAQFAQFETYFDQDLEKGKNWFYMPQMTGQGMQDMVCHIVNDIAYEPLGKDLFSVSMEVIAFDSSHSIPPDVVYEDHIDATEPATPPVDITDATEPSTPPADIINALIPGEIL